ncbi:hypothetical protein BOX15_Mlig015562g1, partial [Macrostomum lignano]
SAPMNGEFGARHRREPVGASWGRSGAWQETYYGSPAPSPPAASGFSATAPASNASMAPSLPSGGAGGCRDRTPEFRAVVSQMCGLGGGAAGWRRRAGATPGAVGESRFAMHARQIGANLNRTGAKMQKLALLAGRTATGHQQLPVSVGEFDELARIVGQDLNGLNQSIGLLQDSIRHSGASPHGQSAAHSSAVVLALQTRLADMSGRYQDTVQLKQQQQKQHQAAYQSDSMHRSQSDASVIDMSGIVEQHQRQGQVLANAREQDERDDAMRSIEQTMVDLGSVFQQLATIVKEQDELVHRIGASVDDTALNVDVAHAELLKFFKSLTSNRSLMLKVFGLLVIFFVLFVVFLR